MSPKSLLVLIIVAIGLGAVLYAARPTPGGSGGLERKELFAELSPEQIAAFEIMQGEKSVKLAVTDGRWTLPERGGYRADFGKVRSFLLKLLGATYSQKVTENESNHEKLGVTDQAVTRGMSRVQFFGENDTAVAGVYLGQLRKKKNAAGVPSAPGQYIRRVDDKGVYLVAEPITLTTVVKNWLDTSLANVLSSNVDSVRQILLSGAEEKVEFALSRDKSSDDQKPEFALEGGLADGEKIVATKTSQVVSGLENLRLEDVFQSDDKSVADLKFDIRSEYQLSNALRYVVLTAERGEDFFGKITVSFDAELAKKLAIATEEATPETEASEGEEETATDQESSGPELSNAEEAEKTNALYSNWVFQLPKYIGQKLRMHRADLMEQPEEATAG